jgi:hypothetical protein
MVLIAMVIDGLDRAGREVAEGLPAFCLVRTPSTRGVA